MSAFGDPKVVRERLAKVMEGRGITVPRLAKKAGMRAETIRRILREGTPQWATMVVLARALHVDTLVLGGTVPLPKFDPQPGAAARVNPGAGGLAQPDPEWDWERVRTLIRIIERTLDDLPPRRGETVRDHLNRLEAGRRHLAAARRAISPEEARELAHRAEEMLNSLRQGDEAPRARPVQALAPSPAPRRRSMEEGDGPGGLNLRVAIKPRKTGVEPKPFQNKGGKISWGIARREVSLLSSKLEQERVRARKEENKLSLACLEAAEKCLDAAGARINRPHLYQPSEVIQKVDDARIWMERANPASEEGKAWRRRDRNKKRSGSSQKTSQ